MSSRKRADSSRRGASEASLSLPPPQSPLVVSPPPRRTGRSELLTPRSRPPPFRQARLSFFDESPELPSDRRSPRARRRRASASAWRLAAARRAPPPTSVNVSRLFSPEPSRCSERLTPRSRPPPIRPARRSFSHESPDPLSDRLRSRARRRRASMTVGNPAAARRVRSPAELELSPSDWPSSRSESLTPRSRPPPFRWARLLISDESLVSPSIRRSRCARCRRASSSVARLCADRTALSPAALSASLSFGLSGCVREEAAPRLPRSSSDELALPSRRNWNAAARRCRSRSRAAKCRAAPLRTVTSSPLSLSPSS